MPPAPPERPGLAREGRVAYSRTMNLRLRTIASRAEARGTLALLEQAVRSQLSDPPAVPAILERVLAGLGTREGLLVVAEPREVERPLALAASLSETDPLTGAVRARLVLLYTDPSIRLRGVARALVGELRGALAARGAAELVALAAHNDDSQISMGERWGFVRTIEVLSAE